MSESFIADTVPCVTESSLDRAIAFLRAAARRQAQQVIDLPHGFAVLDARFPHSYDHNKLVLTAPVSPAEALATADELLGGAGLAHRLITAEGTTGAACADELVATGSQQSVDVIMAHTGAAPDRPADPEIRVEALDVAALHEPGRRDWRERLPTAGEDVIEQLVARRVTRLGAAATVEFLAVRDDTGRIVSRADLYLDPPSGLAQIEDVQTDQAHTRRGYARAIMAEGLRRAQTARCDLVLVVADAYDWPRQLYTRLGYEGIGDAHTFVRPAPD